MGIGRGYSAIALLIAAEQFGTNIRATVTTSASNFARGTLVPITFMFTELTPNVLSPTTTGALLGFLCFLVSLYCIYSIEETYGKDLDYLEMKLVANKETTEEKPTTLNREV